MAKLSKSDEVRARNAVLECIEKTAHITDSDMLNKTAFDILYRELGDKPALLKRACEAYNSNKSIYKLSHADDNTRGDSFALLDAVDMYKKASDKAMVDAMKKTASAGVFTAPRYFTVESEAPMQKTASDPVVQSKPKYDTSNIDVSTKTATYNRVCEVGTACEGLFNKLASDESVAGNKLMSALAAFRNEMLKASPAQRKEAASLICAHYGQFGDELLQRFNATPGVTKVASDKTITYKGTPRLPHNDLYDAARAVREANQLYKRASMLKCKAIADMMTPFRDIMDVCLLRKNASTASLAAGALMGNIMKAAPYALDIKDVDSAKARMKLRTPKLQNALRELEMKRVFYDMMADSYISGFPVPDVLNAFNESVASLPITEQGRIGAHGPLIRSWVTSRLSRGNVPSEADAERILRATEALDRLKYFEDSLNPTGKQDQKAVVGA